MNGRTMKIIIKYKQMSQNWEVEAPDGKCPSSGQHNKLNTCTAGLSTCKKDKEKILKSLDSEVAWGHKGLRCRLPMNFSTATMEIRRE